VTEDETECTVNGQTSALGWDGRYALAGDVMLDDSVTLTFPISERTVKETIGYPFAVDYTLVIRGNTVVFIDPPGEHNPFYRRDHYREDSVRWVRRPRFVWSRPSLEWHY